MDISERLDKILKGYNLMNQELFSKKVLSITRTGFNECGVNAVLETFEDDSVRMILRAFKPAYFESAFESVCDAAFYTHNPEAAIAIAEFLSRQKGEPYRIFKSWIDRATHKQPRFLSSDEKAEFYSSVPDSAHVLNMISCFEQEEVRKLTKRYELSDLEGALSLIGAYAFFVQEPEGAERMSRFLNSFKNAYPVIFALSTYVYWNEYPKIVIDLINGLDTDETLRFVEEFDFMAVNLALSYIAKVAVSRGNPEDTIRTIQSIDQENVHKVIEKYKGELYFQSVIQHIYSRAAETRDPAAVDALAQEYLKGA